MSNDQLALLGAGLGLLGFTVGVWMLLGPGAMDRWHASRRRKAMHDGWASIR